MVMGLSNIDLAKSTFFIWLEIKIKALISYQRCIQNLMITNERMLIGTNDFAHHFPQPWSEHFSQGLVYIPYKTNTPGLIILSAYAILRSKLNS